MKKKLVLSALAALAGLAGTALAAWLATGLDVELLRRCFGGFLLVVGLRELFAKTGRQRVRKTSPVAAGCRNFHQTGGHRPPLRGQRWQGPAGG